MAKLRVDKIASVGVSTENTGSVFFDGNADHLKLPNSTDFNYGSDDFSIEAWVYLLSSAGGSDNHGIASNYITSGNKRSWLLYLAGATPTFIGSSDGTSGNNVTVSSSVDVADETWTHIAVSRTGTTVDLYVNGVKRAGTTSFHSSIYSNTDDPVEIAGYNNGTNTFEGFISNLRICKGHRVYKSNFTVPTRELEVHQGPDDDRTVLLACYDGENIFADKTGRHILGAYGDRSSTPTPARTDSPVGITTENPGLTRDVDVTAGPVFQGGAAFTSQNWLTLPKGTTTERGGDRGLFGGGYDTGSTRTQTIEYINISTSGIALNFGDLIEQHTDSTGTVASSTRGLFGGGSNHPPTYRSDTIEHITMSSTGNGVDFGNLSAGRRRLGSLSNKTRGIFGPGEGDPSNTSQIDLVTIATLGNASDFGDMDRNTEPNEFYATLSSPTRGIFAGGERFDGTVINIIDYITISSLGDAQNFGDLLAARRFVEGCSSQTRGIIAGGTTPSAYDNVIQYITISTLGDAQDFGDLSTSTVRDPHMTSNSIRGVFAGGEGLPALINTIEYVVIASTGNAKDFGDLLDSRRSGPSASNSHGGLG